MVNESGISLFEHFDKRTMCLIEVLIPRDFNLILVLKHLKPIQSDTLL